MGHIIWALVVTLFLQTGEMDQRVHSSHVRHDDCEDAKVELSIEIADAHDGVMPNGVEIRCLPVPHGMIW